MHFHHNVYLGASAGKKVSIGDRNIIQVLLKPSTPNSNSASNVATCQTSSNVATCQPSLRFTPCTVQQRFLLPSEKGRTPEGKIILKFLPPPI